MYDLSVAGDERPGGDDKMGADDKTRRDDRQWYKDPRALVAFAGAAVALAIGVTQLVAQLEDDPPKVSAEYIVDVSQGMAGEIGDKRKLPAVTAEILSHVKKRPACRRPCG